MELFENVKSNKIKTGFIITFFITLVSVFTYFVCYLSGISSSLLIPIAITISILMSIFSYWNSDKIVLAISNARPADTETEAYIHNIIEGLCIATGLPKPKIYIMEDGSPNAFATGRNPQNAVICVTTGLLEKLDYYELEGVLAHELAHIKNYDILLGTIATVMVGFIVIASDWFTRIMFFGGNRRRSDEEKGGGILAIIGIIFLILSPIFANLMKLALSRNREFLADASAAGITRNPQGLINALTKISNDNDPLDVANKSTAHMYIINPFKGNDVAQLFSTHPTTQKRIEALKNFH